MKHLNFLAEKLAIAALGEIGVDIFVGTLPGDVLRGMMLVDPLTGHELDEGMGGFVSGNIQLIVRDPDPEAAYALALAATTALTVGHDANSEVAIAWCRPMTLPVSYPRGDSDEIETSVRFRVGFKLL